MPKERVAIVKVTEQHLDEAVGLLLDLLGGLDVLVPAGSRVMVKPNLVFPPTDRGITHPELIEAIVRLVAQSSPKEIMIGEGSADVYTTQGFRFQGLSRIADRYGARLVDLNLEEGVKTAVPSDLGRDYIMVPRAVAESDVFISVPVFKLWGSGPLSLSLKNLIGLYGARYYGHNHDSQQRGHTVGYGLPGEVGSELGAHQPSVPQSICALNLAVKTDLAIIDALEGGDGCGNFMRLDTLIGGLNPVATDTVCCQMTGIAAADHDTFRLCEEHGLGPCTMDKIEVVGEPIETVSFDLRRLNDGVVEMPIAFCLNLLSAGELDQIRRALEIYGLEEAQDPTPTTRDELLAYLTEIVSAKDYFDRAFSACTDYAVQLATIISEQGGTSTSLESVRDAFEALHDGQFYYPSHRVLGRLGLAYAVDSTTRDYYLLPEGLSQALQHIGDKATERAAVAG